MICHPTAGAKYQFMIEGRRIQSIDRHLAFVPKGISIVFGIRLATARQDMLTQFGLPSSYQVGDTFLPCATMGPVAQFNAEGRYVVHRDRPMETFYMQREWTWHQWRGRDRELRTKIVDIPRKRYPRTFVPPPSLELSVAAELNGDMILITRAFAKGQDSEDVILHAINLLLESFGSCVVLTRGLQALIPRDLRSLNWNVLPRGRRPWAMLQPAIQEIVNGQPEGNRPVIEHRLEFVNRQEPDFVAVGRAGFRGYLVFGFLSRNIFVLESTLPNNATYVLGINWEQLSQLTKAELIGGNLHTARIVHRVGWEAQLRQVLNRSTG